MKVFVDPKALEGAPDASAMAQSMYARSFVSIEDRLQAYIDEAADEIYADGTPADPLDTLREKLNQFYVGYGHQSIAQTGSITLFIEGVNLQVAKLIEDHPLYNGQETSTRAISFDGDDCLADQSNITEYQTKFLNLYRRCFDLLANKVLPSEYPDYTEASVRARAFDIARNLLPIGVKTNLSWHTTLDNFNVQMERLTNYIWLDAVAEAVSWMFATAYLKYPAAIVAPASWELDPACTGETVEHLQQRVRKQLANLKDAVLQGNLSASAFINSIRQPLQLAHNYSKSCIEVSSSEPLKTGSNDLLVTYTDPDDGTVLISCGEANKFGYNYGGADINSHVTSILNLKDPNHHDIDVQCQSGDDKLRLGGNGGDSVSSMLRVSGVTSFATYRDTHRHRTLNPSVPIVLPTVLASVWNGSNSSDAAYAQPAESLISSWFMTSMVELSNRQPEYGADIFFIVADFLTIFKKLLDSVEIEDSLAVTFEENNLRYADFPLATCIPYVLTGTGKNFLHFLQLRAGETVHPELRADIHEIIKQYVPLYVFACEDSSAGCYAVPLQFWLAAHTDWNQENWRRFNRNAEILKRDVEADFYLLAPSTRRGKQNIK